MAKRVPPQVEDTIEEMLRAGKEWGKIQDKTGVSATVISRVRRERILGLGKRQDNAPEISTGVKTKSDLRPETGTVDIEITHEKDKPPRWLDIKDPESFLKRCNIDQKVWDVVSCRVTSSEVTMKLSQGQTRNGRWQEDIPRTYTNVHVTITLARRKIAEQAVIGFCNRLIKGPYKPRPIHHLHVRRDPVLLEWCPYDQHHGMLAWGPEVDEHYDLKISSEFFAEAVRKVIQTASPYNISQVVMPVGQDWFHCNDPTNLTPFAKHQLDVEGRLLKVFETGYWALFKAIEQLRQMAPVHILWVPGNHDPETSYYLVRALAAHYMDIKGQYNCGVTVDYSPKSRKVYSWGNSCIGFSHPVSKGSWERQRGVFSEVFKKEWADAKYHEIHTGHLHKVMEYEFMQADTLGSHTVIRMVPSLCATDKWHWEQGYVEKNRASASFIWSHGDGLVCQFTTRVKDDR